MLQAYVARIDHDEENGGKRIFPVRWHLDHKAWMQAGFQKDETEALFNEHQIARTPERRDPRGRGREVRRGRRRPCSRTWS